MFVRLTHTDQAGMVVDHLRSDLADQVLQGFLITHIDAIVNDNLN